MAACTTSLLPLRSPNEDHPHFPWLAVPQIGRNSRTGEPPQSAGGDAQLGG
jgi:hypothetical protein